MVKTKVIEVHITHSCNLKCQSCTHAMGTGLHSFLPFDEAERWYKLWSKRLQVDIFNVLGGEPTLHPELVDHVYLAATYWKPGQVCVVTNGLALPRHRKLGKALADVGGFLIISIQYGSEDFLKSLEPSLKLADSWHKEYGLPVIKRESWKNWGHIYYGHGATMLPYEDNQPRKSWELCGTWECHQLHEGKLWKCPPVAYLGLIKKKYPRLSEKWDKYLAYKPLEPDCTEPELVAFLQKQEEGICGMCPAFLRKTGPKPDPRFVPLNLPPKKEQPPQR